MHSFMEQAQAAHQLSEDELRSMKEQESSSNNSSSDVGEEVDTWIFPSVQMGPLGVHQDSQLTEKVLRAGQPGRRKAPNRTSPWPQGFIIMYEEPFPSKKLRVV
jgi:hypothetical protein